MVKRLQEERGQAMVELAIIMPLLLLLVFGIVEFGRIYSAYITVNHASREGARAAAVGTDDPGTKAVVSGAANGLPSDRLVIDITPATRKRGDMVTVAVAFAVPIQTPVINRIVPNPLTVKGVTTMRVE